MYIFVILLFNDYLFSYYRNEAFLDRVKQKAQNENDIKSPRVRINRVEIGKIDEATGKNNTNRKNGKSKAMVKKATARNEEATNVVAKMKSTQNARKRKTEKDENEPPAKASCSVRITRSSAKK